MCPNTTRTPRGIEKGRESTGIFSNMWERDGRTMYLNIRGWLTVLWLDIHKIVISILCSITELQLLIHTVHSDLRWAQGYPEAKQLCHVLQNYAGPIFSVFADQTKPYLSGERRHFVCKLFSHRLTPLLHLLQESSNWFYSSLFCNSYFGISYKLSFQAVLSQHL